jgi:hypothetical protein
MAGFVAASQVANTSATSIAKRTPLTNSIFLMNYTNVINYVSYLIKVLSNRKMSALHAVILGAASVEYVDEQVNRAPEWVRDDNIAVYDLNIPNRVVRGNYSIVENGLASPAAKRHILGVVGGNDVSRLAGNPQDIESDLTWRTRPLTNCPSREYKPTLQGQEKIVINNRKTHLAIDIRPVHLPEYQMWAYPQTFAPLPLKKETCGRPEKY